MGWHLDPVVVAGDRRPLDPITPAHFHGRTALRIGERLDHQPQVVAVEVVCAKELPSRQGSEGE